MKNRTIFALLLAVILAVPVFAQQTSTPPAQTTATQSATAADSATGKAPLQPETREGFWGRMNPFARKKYVARQTDPIRDRINELDELTASNTKAIKDTDARAQQGIQLASAKANEADQHAIEAGNKAQAAQQTAQQANTRVTTVEQVVTNIDQYQPTTQTEILFKPGQTVLSQNAKTALDEMATPAKKSAWLRRRSAGFLFRSWTSGDLQLAEDGRVGGPLPGAQPRHSGLPDLPRRHGQCPSSGRSLGGRRQAEAHYRWSC